MEAQGTWPEIVFREYEKDGHGRRPTEIRADRSQKTIMKRRWTEISNDKGDQHRSQNQW